MAVDRVQDEIPGALRLFFLAAFFLNIVAVFCEAFARHFLRLHWPYNTPLLNERPVPDLQNYIEPFKHIHTTAFFDLSYPAPYMYPAPVAPLYGFFLNLPWPVRTFQITLVLLLVAAAILFGIKLFQSGLSSSRSAFVACATLLLSYPAAFELKQGNMEIFVCILVGAGVWCFLTDRLHVAAACIGIAGAMKIFPFVYLGLFLSRRVYRPIVTSVVTAVVVSVITLLYLYPSIPVSWHGVGGGLALYQEVVALQLRIETGFDHSLFGVIKVAIHHRLNTARLLEPVVKGYLAVAAVGGIALFFTRIRNLPVINQVLCLSVASILLPPVSYDYTLLHLYVPWAMLVFFALRNALRNVAGLRAAFVCLAWLTSIQTEIIYRGRTFGGQTKAVALIVLILVALLFPFRDVEGTERADLLRLEEV